MTHVMQILPGEMTKLKNRFVSFQSRPPHVQPPLTRKTFPVQKSNLSSVFKILAAFFLGAGPFTAAADMAAFQKRIDAAASNSVVQYDPNEQLVFSSPLRITKPLTIAGLRARLPEKLGNSSLIIVESKGVSIIDFELVGNGDTVPQDQRAPLVAIHAGGFRVERGTFLNSSKDGVMI